MQKGEQIVFRVAEEGKDETSLAQILSECFGPITPRRMRRWLRQEKKEAAGQERFFVAEVDGKVVGTVSVARLGNCT